MPDSYEFLKAEKDRILGEQTDRLASDTLRDCKGCGHTEAQVNVITGRCFGPRSIAERGKACNHLCNYVDSESMAHLDIDLASEPQAAPPEPLTALNLSKADLRLLDLVRYSRHSLHEENLITDDEFVALVFVGAESARRLESYDAIRATTSGLAEALRVAAENNHSFHAVNGNGDCIRLDECEVEACVSAREALARYEGKGQSDE